MKKTIKYLLIYVFLIMVFLIPLKVEALSYKSDYKRPQTDTIFDTDEFSFNLEYDESKIVNKEKVRKINVFSNKKIVETYYYHYIIYFYDNEKQEIGSIDGYDIINDNETFQQYLYKSEPILILEKHMISPNDQENIIFYRVFIEPSSESVVNNYIKEQKKLNEFGIDPINDNNTIEMKSKIFDGIINKRSLITKYDITKYNVNIIVNENNTFNITEKISVNFKEPRHGIIRKIPLKNVVSRLDGSISKNRTKIDNLKISDNYTVSNIGVNKVIKIGDPNYVMTGVKDYEISYLYNIGKDPKISYDEFYFNIIGNEWDDTKISGISFTIIMPKEFNQNKLGFSSGRKGSTNSSSVYYEVKGNVITGFYDESLEENEGLTVRLELPNGYFVGAKNVYTSFEIFSIIFPVICVLIAFLIWKKYGKDDQVIDTVEFYPPEGFNSAEVGFLYKGYADSVDVTSLLVYLANKGYLKIGESDDQEIIKKGFKITKLKEYDGNNINEKTFFKGLFSNKKTISDYNSIGNSLDRGSNIRTIKKEIGNYESVTEIDLYDSFYLTLDLIMLNINNNSNKDKIFEFNPLKNLLIKLMAIIIFLLITVKPVFEYDRFSSVFYALIFTGFGILLFNIDYVNKLFGSKTKKREKKENEGKVVFAVTGFIIWLISFAVTVFPAIQGDFRYQTIYFMGLIAILILFEFDKHMPKRTIYGSKILGKIKGFKDFLEMVEKEKLEELVMEDPTYFYNILPYTYVLDISDKWIKKFENISLQAPNWYSESETFNNNKFNTFISNTMDSANRTMSSNISTGGSGGGSSGGSSGGGSSGGGSSGGGSSGGGSGGGGGGSW